MAKLFSACRILCSRQALLRPTTLRNLNSPSFSKMTMPTYKKESELLYKVKEQVYRLNMPLNQAGQRRHKVTQTVTQIKFDVEEDETAVEEANAFNEAASLSINAGETEIVAVEEEKKNALEVASATSSSNQQAEGEATVRTADKTEEQQRNRGEASVRVLQTEIKYHRKKSHYTCRVVVPKPLLGRVVGREQSKKKELEISTNSSIKILKNEVDEGTEIFEISALLLEDVERCKRGLESAIDEAKEKCGPNHFISVPLEGFGSLVEEYVRLVESIQKEQDIPEECRRPKLFMPKEKIHLTLSTLLLFTKEDEKRAIKHLDEMMQNDIPLMLSEGGGPLEVKFPRLGFFGEKLKKAKVLFADIECDRLVTIANHIDKAYKAGLAEERRPGDVKLHMTIGNIKYLHDRPLERRGLDLRKVMEKFGETRLQSVNPSEIRICKMLSVDPVTKSYPVLHSVKFK